MLGQHGTFLPPKSVQCHRQRRVAVHFVARQRRRPDEANVPGSRLLLGSEEIHWVISQNPASTMSEHLLLNSPLLKSTQWSRLVRCRWLQISRILFSRKVHVTKRHPSRGRKSQPAVLSDGEGITKECLVAGRILQEMLGASLIFYDFHPFTSEQTSCTKYPDPPDEDLKWPKGKKKSTKKQRVVSFSAADVILVGSEKPTGTTRTNDTLLATASIHAEDRSFSCDPA